MSDRVFQSQSQVIQRQDSDLSPMLYNLYTPDISRSVQTQLSVYGNYIFIFHKTKSPRFAHLAVQRHFSEIRRQTSEWCIDINPEKTRAIVISKRTRLHLPELELRGDKINYLPRFPFLGVILDHRMNWKPHVKVLMGKTHGSLTVFSPLLRSSLLTRAKLLIYKTYIRPTMTYYAPAWVFISKTWYTWANEKLSDLAVIKLESFMKYLALKLCHSARNRRNRYIKILELISRKPKISKTRSYPLLNRRRAIVRPRYPILVSLNQVFTSCFT